MTAGEPSNPAAGARRADPIADDELARLFAPLAPFGLVLLAVSGGSDSMALLHLVARWKEACAERAPEIAVATVDHGLRPESGSEARWVEARAQALGLGHAVLVWRGEKPASAIQEAAREARYRLLAEHARAFAGGRPAAVATAHTEDDQAETFLMRLARGSGLDGLAAMPSRRTLSRAGSVEIVRPLLTVAKARLIATLEVSGYEWIDDPSNECRDFERVRLREGRAALAALGLTNDKLALSARRLRRAREALDREADDVFEQADLHEGVFATLDRKTLAEASAEIRVRVLARLLAAFGGEARPARLVQVEALAVAVEGGERFAQTLGGCMISGGRKWLRVYCEPGQRSLPEIALEPGSETVWDGRFRVAAAPAPLLAAAGIALPIRVSALKRAAYATVRRSLEPGRRPPTRAALSLPAFWSADRLLAAPNLASFRPAGVSADVNGAGEAQLFSSVFERARGLRA